MKKIIIFGNGPFAISAYQLYREIPDAEVIAFMVDDRYIIEKEIKGVPVWGSSLLDKDDSIVKKYQFLLCVGYAKMRNRKLIFDRLKEKGCQFTNLIHPSVMIQPDVKMGVNNILCAAVIIEHSVTIGDNNVFWTRGGAAHNAVIGSHNYFAGRVVVSGNCVVGDLCFFGNNSFSTDGRNFADETYLVAGSGLFSDSESCSKYFGVPARKVGEHFETGIEIQ